MENVNLPPGRGNWKLAPAYDLTFSRSAHGQHSITVAGEGRHPTLNHFLELARIFNVENPDKIINEVRQAVQQWSTIAEALNISKRIINEISREMKAASF